MTITQAPQIEAKLKEVANREGRHENALADALLAEVLEAATCDHQEMIAGLESGRQAYAEGRSRILSDYMASVMEHRQRRNATSALEEVLWL